MMNKPSLTLFSEISDSDSPSSSSMSDAVTEQEDLMIGEEMEIIIGCNDLEGGDLLKQM